MIGDALYSLAMGQTAITDLIGDRLYAVMLPQGLKTFPAAAYRINHDKPNYSFDGNKYDYVFTDLFAYGHLEGDGYNDCVSVWNALRYSLEGQTGTFGSIAVTDIRYMDSGNEDFIDNLKLFTKQLELRISFINNN